MTDQRPLVSIVCPAYQEEDVLPIFHQHLCAVLDKLETGFRFEILYVDDGSADRTVDVIHGLAAADPRVGCLSLSRNFGHQAALTAGLEHARGDAVVSLDSDLQHPPELIADLLKEWQAGHDVVITLRADDQRLGWFKRLSSATFYRLMRRLSDTEIRFAASDFRLLSRRAAQALVNMGERHRFVRGMVQWIGFPVKEIAFQPNERRAGASKYTLRRMLRLAGDGLFSFTRLPLQAPLYLGAAFFALGLLHTVLGLIQVIHGAATSSWHYLLVILSWGLASLLGSLGIIGEYLGRIHEETKRRPVYVLKECTLPALDGAVVQERQKAA